MRQPTSRLLLLAAIVMAGVSVSVAQTQPAPKNFVLANDKLELTIATNGGRFARLIMKEGEPLTPLATMGHFLALDGFGAPSAQEQTAGMPFHGEANRQPFQIVITKNEGSSHLVTLQATLPLAQETLTRTIEAVDGENLIYVTSELESDLSIDRPVSWAEHATIGPPFMEKGKVVVDMPATNCRVRPEKPGRIPGHLVSNHDLLGRWRQQSTAGKSTFASSPQIITGSISLVARWIRPAELLS